MKSDVELADQLTVAGWKILFAMKDENNSENTQKKKMNGQNILHKIIKRNGCFELIILLLYLIFL